MQNAFNSYCHVAFVLDRSGSMDSIATETIDGFNHFLEEQQSVRGKATFTLVLFDTTYTVVYDHEDITNAKPLTNKTYQPHGGTALYDAVGRAAEEMSSYLAALPEIDRPANVVLVILTDGAENGSSKYNKTTISRLLRDKQKNDGWQVVYLGAGGYAFEEAKAMGIGKDSTAVYNYAAPKAAYERVSAKTSSLRTGLTHDMEFDEKDRQVIGEGAEE